MILLIIFTPLLGFIFSGLLGRYLGVNMTKFLVCISIFIPMIISYYIYYMIFKYNIEYSIDLIRWIDIDYLNINWIMNIDKLTVSMLIPVLTISFLVNVYSCSYMSTDPHQQRFFSYLAMFTFFMVILVTGNNYLVLFVGWEYVGVTSYLLISFWYTRLSAAKSALTALLLNRVGDTFFILGLGIIIWTFGSLDFNVIFALSSYINTDIINLIMIFLILAATAKSAQLGLHNWLTLAMEGPTPVSSLLHAATMVKMLPCKIVRFYIINSLYAGITLSQVYKYIIYYYYYYISYLIYNNILGVYNILINYTIFNYYIIKKVNQQVTLINYSQYNDIDYNKGTSETKCELSYNSNSNSNFNFNNLYNIIDYKIDTKFLEWFIGFVEGDGSLISTKRNDTKAKYIMFDITQTLSDVQVLYNIKSTLGFGKVLLRPEKHRDVGVYYVTGKKNFLKLIHIFNGNICTKHKLKQLEVWINYYNEIYKDDIKFINRLNKPSLNNAWISGFIDAEGSFQGRLRKSNTNPSKYYPNLIFELSQKDKDILELVRYILINKDSKYIRYDTSWQGYKLGISNIKLLKLITNYINRYKLKTRKHILYLKWKNLLIELLNKRHLYPHIQQGIWKRVEELRIKKKTL